MATEEKRLISFGLLSRKAFKDDLVKFLRLSKAQLQQLDVASQGPDGFWPASQSLKFAEQAAIPSEDARAILEVAQFLYEGCREQSISPEAGTTQLIEICESLKVPDAAEKRDAFICILSTKESYEKGRRAQLRATEFAGHIEDLEGIWDLRPVFHRESGEIIAKVPVLIINITWHDNTRTTHEAVFQLAERDWEEFKNKIDKLEKQWRVVQREIEKS